MSSCAHVHSLITNKSCTAETRDAALQITYSLSSFGTTSSLELIFLWTLQWHSDTALSRPNSKVWFSVFQQHHHDTQHLLCSNIGSLVPSAYCALITEVFHPHTKTQRIFSAPPTLVTVSTRDALCDAQWPLGVGVFFLTWVPLSPTAPWFELYLVQHG